LEIRKPNEPRRFMEARNRAAEIVAAKALDCLTQDEASGLVRRGKISLYGAREALVTRGDSGNSMFVILDGEVEVIGKAGGGPRVVLAKLGPGDCFGEMSLLTGEPRNATVRAEADALVLEIRKGDLSPLIDSNPELAERLGELLERRQREWEDKLKDGRETTATEAPAQQKHRSFTARIRDFFNQSTD
jgi:CRP-like cAMP-binding protein